MSIRVLVVDDDAQALSAFSRMLAPRFQVDTAHNGRTALETVEDKGPYAVVLSDMRMPDMSGLELLVRLQRRAPETVRIMLTGMSEQKVASDAVNDARVFRFLSKACTPEELIEAVQAAVQHNVSIRAERELLEKTFNGIVEMLTDILAAHDPESFGMGQRLRSRARAVCKRLDIESPWEIEAAAMLLRVGTTTVPQQVLDKQRRNEELDGTERDMIHRIPEMGARLVEHIPRLANVAEIIRRHQQDYSPAEADAGSEIPLEARILRALADLQMLEIAGVLPASGLEDLKSQEGRYDQAVLRAIEHLIKTPAESAADFYEMLTVSNLRPGIIVAVPVLSTESVTLVPAETPLTPLLVERLRNFGELGEVREPIYVLDTSRLQAQADSEVQHAPS